jgi:transcription elongation factor GreA
MEVNYMEKVTSITESQKNELQAELEQLKEQQIENLRDKEEAFSKGDLSENAEYESAKKKERILANEIALRENILRTAKVIKETSNGNTISIGNIVRLRILDSDIPELSREEGVEFRVVPDMGSAPNDNKMGQISIRQAVGKLIYNREWHGKPEVLYYTDRDNKQRTLQILDVK